MQIPVNFNPRPYQMKALAALEAGVKVAVWCWARRGGKDLTGFAYAVKKMVETPMNVVLVFPTLEQGRKAFWENIENDGFKTVDHIPKALRAGTENSDMVITLKNGSVFRVLGATNPDSLRGANGKLYIFSEFVDIPVAALNVIRPIVRNNHGQIIIQSTPKIDGISGGSFKIIFDRAMKREDQYASLITAKEFLNDAELEEARQEAIEENGNDFFFRQEYLCDWGQASSSSYYGYALQKNKVKKNIGYFPYDRAHSVYTAWDLGTSDSTAITFFQYIDKKPRILDYYETHDIGYAPMVKFLGTKPYNYAWHFLPHDGTVRDQSDAVQRVQKIKELGLINASTLVRENVNDGINRAVVGIVDTEINEGTTLDLIRKLRLYKRKFNALTGDYEGPDHKTESHAADSVRYVYAAI